MAIAAYSRVSLSAGARQTNLTPQGLLKILHRTNSAIRDDGRWYADQTVIDQIAKARRVLGVDRGAHARVAHQAGAAA
jgi:hypothetical protein